MFRYWYLLEGKPMCIEAEFDAKAIRIIRNQMWDCGQPNTYVEVWQFGRIVRKRRICRY